MTRITLGLVCCGLFVLGLLAGVYLQHRWPVGRWGEDKGPAPQRAEIDVARVAALPAHRRLVVLVAGQSNAANYGSVRANAGPGVYAWHDGALFQAKDPLPGADQYRGSPWTRLGAMLMLTGDFDAVVFAPLAQGSSLVSDWAPGGKLHGRLQDTLRALGHSKLAPDLILWQQGESEGGSPDATGAGYLEAMTALVASTRESTPGARWVIARATYTGPGTGNAQIREAQRLAALLPGARSGPDLDVLDASYRSDGVHFNERGLETVAALWHDALAPLLADRDSP
jgi:lysophospholipase L1-like esterase